MKKILLTLLLLPLTYVSAIGQTRWDNNSKEEIVWKINESDKAHSDFIESSGKSISNILYYSVDDNGRFSLSRKCVWPMLRTVPNNTHASLIREFGIEMSDLVNINDEHGSDGITLKNEKTDSIKLKGYMEVFSRVPNRLSIKRTMYPSTDKPVWCEQYSITNISEKNIKVNIPELSIITNTDPKDGVTGTYNIRLMVHGGGYYTLKPGDSVRFNVDMQAKRQNEEYVSVDFDKELQARKEYLNEISNSLVLNTPNNTLNTMFNFAKVRASESIFDTAGGLMHAPGGGDYYAAVWANDQAEYINPFFPFLGYEEGNESAINSYRHFARFINEEYTPIPSSIIAEGVDIWNGAKDRGDAAMIAYGASRYALERANAEEAKGLWTLIEWCLEYSRRQLNDEGVVMSDSDELEGRFPAGDANLCTSSLYYDALISASYLTKELGMPSSKSKDYKKQAETLRANMKTYFEATVEGYDTYRYYDGNDILRSWISIPLTVGIYDRVDGTIKALFSDRLWTDDGLATEAGDVTFWDRSTLYALRGIFAAGHTEKALEYLNKYSERRLLGDHVPYGVEAYPEGGQAQLSAESGLYCRIFIEGVFGIRPTGFKSFTLTPQLPNGWNNMSLSNIKAFGDDFNIDVIRMEDKIRVIVTDSKGKTIVRRTIKEGSSINVKL